jgi:glutamine synthetase
MQKYSQMDIISFVEQNDVKFIRLAFCDIFGRMKNIAILPTELKRAFKYGMPFDVSAYLGRNYITGHELRLFPIASTLSLMPWRPKTGSVIRLLCDIRETDGSVFELDQRNRLKSYNDELVTLQTSLTTMQVIWILLH